jgi:hypothetical protein
VPHVTLDTALAQAVCVVIREQFDVLQAAHATEVTALRAEIRALKAELLDHLSTPGVPGERGEPGVPGKDAEPIDPELLRELIQSEVTQIIAKAISEFTTGAGEVLKETVAAIERTPGPPGEPGPSGVPGKDGASLEDLRGMIEAELARWALEFERRAWEMYQRSLEKFAPPKDGIDGQPGRDGFGFEHMTMDYDGERTFTWTYTRGDEVKTFAFEVPLPFEAGIWKRGQSYAKGAIVTCGGSAFIAQRETTDAPETPESGWRLFVKRGRDGKDGKGEKGEPGEPGPRGRDLTQRDFEGRRF